MTRFLQYEFNAKWFAAFALLFWAFAATLHHQNKLNAQNKYLNPPPEYIERFHFGFRESMADSFWIRWIQDGDYCQTYLKPTGKVNSPEKSEMDLGSNPRYKMCDNSWSYKMLDAVTLLSPRFYMPYTAGLSMLAILVEDYEGATKLYERGLKEYPKDWQLLYRAAFHWQYDLKDKKRAAELLIAAADNGGPDWIRSLASRLLTAAGELEFALNALVNYRESVKDSASEEALDKIDKRIKALQDQINKAKP